ncbi:MAG: PQQ-binding-like beta-propeller repeat protein [Rhodothermales bacterium]
MMNAFPRPACYVAALVMLVGCTDPSTDAPYTTWHRYEGEPGATTFSAHDQIDRSNVDRLEVAWTYMSQGAVESNPIVVDSMMYVIDDTAVVALHAATGVPIWRSTGPVDGGVRGRGVMYWESDDRSDRRILFTKGSYALMAVDALSGETITSFGSEGVVDLREGMGMDPELVARATSGTPGVIFEDVLILGNSPGEGYIGGPGHIRGFDVRTGEQEWIFHTLPKRGEFGYDTWPEGRSDSIGTDHAWGGANAWGGMSVDAERGIVYVPLGSANYDFYGVDRHGENLFANSLVALDARTGEWVWHFQTLHHDIWDFDLASTPILLTVEHEGERKDVVAQATKTGMVFVFDRVTGEPLWPIEERPVPSTSPMEGEQPWPTQPFPTKPESFVPLEIDFETDINPYLLPEERDSIVAAMRAMHYEGLYTPPSTQPTIQYPGNRGGSNWGATAGDPRDGTLYVLGWNMPSILELEPVMAGNVGRSGSPIDRGQSIYQANCQICHGADLEGVPNSGSPSLVGVTNRLAHDELDEVIRRGRNLMPAFMQLTDNEVESLKMYLANPELALTEGASNTVDTDPDNVERYHTGFRHMLDSRGLPVVKPPWFRITAYDLNTGEIKWQAPVGSVDFLAEQGIDDTGSANWLRGGPAVTAGGLLFQMTAEHLRALDIDTGDELWAGELPAIGDGIPAVYEVGGRQYVVVSASGLAGEAPNRVDRENQRHGYIAFALPQSAVTD